MSSCYRTKNLLSIMIRRREAFFYVISLLQGVNTIFFNNLTSAQSSGYTFLLRSIHQRTKGKFKTIW